MCVQKLKTLKNKIKDNLQFLSMKFVKFSETTQCVSWFQVILGTKKGTIYVVGGDAQEIVYARLVTAL